MFKANKFRENDYMLKYMQSLFSLYHRCIFGARYIACYYTSQTMQNEQPWWQRSVGINVALRIFVIHEGGSQCGTSS